MEESILTSTKKVLGLAEAYEVFDEDILMHINSTISVLTQIGVGPEEGFIVEDASQTWSNFITEDLNLKHMVRSYIFLKVRMLFDPPTTSFTISAYEKLASEYEYRMNLAREQPITEATYPVEE